VFLAPFVVGLVALAARVVVEYRKREPLMPVKALSSQLPVTGTLVAMIAGAVVVTAVQLVQTFLADVAHARPAAAGAMFWPLPAGVLLAAALFGLLLRSRWLPLLVLGGLAALTAAGVLLLSLTRDHPAAVVGGAAALLGFGAGATVSPGLFLAAFGVPAQTLGRAFALVELLRSESAFAVAPVVAVVAQSTGDLAGGVRLGLLVVTALAGLGLLVALVIPAVSGARLRAPDLDTWLGGDGKALPSPATATHLRPSVEDDEAEPLLPRRS
jgi:hypothetical protein